MNIIEESKEALRSLRKVEPLTHCITNYITANDCANAILAIGGSPTMADAVEEVEEMAAKANALVINLGSITKQSLEAMIKAGKSANKNKVPIVFDPVGVGATNFRKESAFKLLENVKFSVIRGNMAEIKTLSGLASNTKGVDSSEDVGKEDSKLIAKNLARKLNTVVAITGVTDYISDGERVITIDNGCKMLRMVTGTGCMTTALVGTFLGGEASPLACAVAAVATMGIAGEISKAKLSGNEGSGTFRVGIIDAIYNMKEEDFEKVGKISE